MKKFQDKRGHRSDKYQVFFHEVPCTSEFMDSFDNTHSMEHHLNPYAYNEDLMDLEEELRKVFWAQADEIMTPRQKAVFHMYADGYTQMEIADILGVNQSSITKSLRGNTDYYHGNAKVYGGVMKKLKKLVCESNEIQELLRQINELKEERS